jgi:hypothetical protein
MDLRVSAISFNLLRSVTTYGTQATSLRSQRPPKDGQNRMTPVALAAAGSRPTGNGRSIIGDQAKLSQLSSHFNVDEGILHSASSAKELVDLLRQNGADLSQLKNVLKSGDLLSTSA